MSKNRLQARNFNQMTIQRLSSFETPFIILTEKDYQNRKWEPRFIMETASSTLLASTQIYLKWMKNRSKLIENISSSSRMLTRCCQASKIISKARNRSDWETVAWELYNFHQGSLTLYFLQLITTHQRSITQRWKIKLLRDWIKIILRSKVRCKQLASCWAIKWISLAWSMPQKRSSNWESMAYNSKIFNKNNK